MPQTVNGFGTWYWGKDRVHTVQGRCEFCGLHGPLRSYNTNLFVVALFIPIIPLGRKRILNECPRCTRHRAVALKKWMDMQERDIAAASQAAQQDPHSEEKASAAVGTAVAYEAQEEFELLAERFDRLLPRSPLLQAAVASGYEYFGKTDRAEAHFARSLAAKDDPDVREALALLMLRTARPDEARRLLAHVTRDARQDKLPLLMFLVETYQAQGRHAEALEVLDEIESAFPGVKTEWTHRNARETSEKNRASGKPVNKGVLKSLAPQGVRRRNFTSLLPRLIPPAILAALLAWYLGAAYHKGRARPVHLVNGLNLTYDVEVNGRNYSLPAYAHRQIEVGEGDVQVNVRRLDLNRTVPLRTPFWSRPFKSPTFVLNPDGVALIACEDVVYTVANTSPGEEARPKLYAGQLVHDLGSIDYAFVDPPSELKMSGKTARTHKTQARVLRDYGPAGAVRVALDYADVRTAADLVRSWLAVDPQNVEVLQLVPDVMPPDDAERALRPRLAARPVDVESHRVYQYLVERQRPQHDLRGEYAALLDRDPDNAALCYLLARATRDRAESRRLLARAAALPKPDGYVFFALSYDAAARADFAAALEHARRARSLAPENAAFHALEVETLLALGRHDEALRLAQSSSAPGGGGEHLEIQILARGGDLEAARARAERHVARLEKAVNKQTADVVRAHFDATFAYVAGDEAKAAKVWAQMPTDDARLCAALTEGRVSDAAAAAGAAAQTGEERSTGYLLLYIAAKVARDDPAAAKALGLACAELRKGDHESKLLADWLASDAPPDAAVACDLVQLPAEKRLAMTALGLRHPPLRQPCFPLAQRLNYDTRFPHLLIRRATSTTPP